MSMYQYKGVTELADVKLIDVAGVATPVCGRNHPRSMYDYTTAPPVAAVAVFVTFDSRDNVEKLVFVCKKHLGVLHSLKGRYANGYEDNRVREVRSDLFPLMEVAAHPGAVIAAYNLIRQQELKEVRDARRKYLDEHRLQELLDADSELSRTTPGDVKTVTDEYGATTVSVKLSDGYGAASLSVPNARAVARALLAAADLANQKNIAAIAKETGK